VCQGPEERSLERLEFVSGDFIHISRFYSIEIINEECFHRQNVPRIVCGRTSSGTARLAESHAPTSA
jgi:hypothetical protein